MAVINGSTDVGVVDDRSKKKLPDDYVPPFDANKMLQNESVQAENEEDNEGNSYLLGCADMAAFESKLSTHFITYFELCGLQILNNASNRRTFKEKMLQTIQQCTRNHFNDLVTDGTEVDKFEDN
eukprot:7080918-Ditylum_brightwellii.AAC.1